MATYTANADRGEVEIVLGGKAYPMRPSMTAMDNIEQSLGYGQLRLATRAMDRDLTLDDMAHIVTFSVRAAGADRDDPILKAFDMQTVKGLVYEGGIINAMAPICLLLQNALHGGSKAPPKKNPQNSQNKLTDDD